MSCRVENCRKCDIALGRKNIVNGVGNLNGKVMIIGEAPGYYEDKHGVPFVGNSGQLLDTMLNLIGLTRKDVYITNVIKCRPPNNRNPLAVEINNCLPHLIEEIKTIKPKIIILLGGIALNTYFRKSNLTVGKLKGYIIPSHNDSFVMTMYHPSYVLRNKHNVSLLKGYVQGFKTFGLLYRATVNPLITFKI